MKSILSVFTIRLARAQLLHSRKEIHSIFRKSPDFEIIWLDEKGAQH
ncbi:MAG: hypothetical protein ACK56K_14430 [Akkermansiaceae bacterium]|jgi:hypothetical protein